MAGGAILYLRVSTEEQVSNLSLDVQEQACRELCAREGWSVVAAFREEGASAKTLERPRLQQLLAYVGKSPKRVDHVVVYRVDRLSRNREDFYVVRHALRRHGVRLVSASERIAEDSIEAVIVETFSVLQAQIDNIIRSGRSRAGMTEAARRGRWVWQPPIGYRLAPRDGEGRHTGLEPDPDQAPHVRRAFELAAAGVSVRAAHRELAAAGMSVDGRRPVRYEVFRRMLRRPLYAGRLECAALGVSADSSAPALVDEATWIRAQAALGRRDGPYRRRPEASVEFPLRGVVRCSCGRRLVAYRARGKTGRRWPYYRCLRCERNFPAAHLEASWSTLLERLAAPEEVVALFDRMVSRLLEQRAADYEDRLARARRRLGAAEDRLERLLAMRADDEITAEEYAAARGRVTGERDAARLEIVELTAPADVDRGVASAWGRRLLTRPAEVWIELAAERRPLFAERLFPAGVALDEAGALSNPEKSLLLLPFAGDFGAEYSAGGPQVVACEPSDALARILSWRRELREFEALVLGRAA